VDDGGPEAELVRVARVKAPRDESERALVGASEVDADVPARGRKISERRTAVHRARRARRIGGPFEGQIEELDRQDRAAPRA
jgi:hypothetical protein